MTTPARAVATQTVTIEEKEAQRGSAAAPTVQLHVARRLTRVGYAVIATIYVVSLARLLVLRQAGGTSGDADVAFWIAVLGFGVVAAAILTFCTSYRVALGRTTA